MKLRILLFFFFTQSLQATFVGNPADPSILMRGLFSDDSSIVRVKVQGTFDRIARCSLKEDGQIFTMRSSLGYGGLLVNFWERLDAYLHLGGGKVTLSNVTHERGFSWQGGGKLMLIQMKNSYLGFDVKYWMVRPFQSSRINGWQIAGGLTQQIGFFYPYLGFAVSRIKWHRPHRTFKENHSANMIFGASFSNGKYLYADLEGRVIHEKAFSATVTTMF